jgi:hypothetical protein
MSFEAEWARCAAWLDGALAHAGRSHRLADVEAMVRAGEAQFWPGARCALVTTIEDDPLERRLVIWLAGGSLAELIEDFGPRLDRWARGQGCRRIVLIGRPGWERALKPIGYAPVARIVAKEL